MNGNRQPINMDDLLNKMRGQVEADFDAGRDVIFQSLVENKEANCTRIDERLFAEYFLPFFLGERNDNPNWIVEWIGIAGTPSTEVAVEGFENGVKKTLFFVPPFMNTSLISDNKGTKYSMIMDRYSLEKDASPFRGMAFLEQEFGKKSEQTIQQEFNQVTAQYAHQWDYIRARYRGHIQTFQPQPSFTDNSLNDLMAE